MAKLNGRDYLFIGVLIFLMAVFTVGSGRGKGKAVPVDARHRPIYEARKVGRSQVETELVCSTCHGKNSIPLPKNHPPKEQCLICHQLVG